MSNALRTSGGKVGLASRTAKQVVTWEDSPAALDFCCLNSARFPPACSYAFCRRSPSPTRSHVSRPAVSDSIASSKPKEATSSLAGSENPAAGGGKAGGGAGPAGPVPLRPTVPPTAPLPRPVTPPKGPALPPPPVPLPPPKPQTPPPKGPAPKLPPPPPLPLSAASPPQAPVSIASATSTSAVLRSAGVVGRIRFGFCSLSRAWQGAWAAVVGWRWRRGGDDERGGFGVRAGGRRVWSELWLTACRAAG